MANLLEFMDCRPHDRCGALLVPLFLALSVASAQGAIPDRYLDVGPLGAKPKLVESVEGFLVTPTAAGFTGIHTDYPDHLSQVIGPSPYPSGTGFPDENFLVDRLSNNRNQRAGAAGDFNGNGIDGKVLVYETNQLASLAPRTPLADKALWIVISEEGVSWSVHIPTIGTENDGSIREAILPLNIDPDPDPAGLGTRDYDRSIRVAVGQIDDDPADEIVVAYWTESETIQIVVLDLADTDGDLLGDTLEVFSLSEPLQERMLKADLTIQRGDGINRSSIAFALALGDYDGDLIDEIALVYPKPHDAQSLIEGFNQAEVVIYEFTAAPTGSVVVRDGYNLFPSYTVYTGAIIPSGGGSFDVPFPGTPGSLIPPGPYAAGTAVRLKRMIATAANLPYASDPNIDRIGAPRESLVVGLQMQQHNLGDSWKVPSALVWLRPSRFDDCPVPTNGNTKYCLLNQAPVLNHTRTSPAGYGDDGYVFPSTFCLDAANLRDDPDNPAQDGRDEIVMMFDPHLFVMSAVEGGADLKSSDSPVPPVADPPPASLVNADPSGSCYGNEESDATKTAGACAQIGDFHRMNGGRWGVQCSLTVADVNGHQEPAPGGSPRSEILLDLRESFSPTETRAWVVEVNPDDLTRNNAHGWQYVGKYEVLTTAFAIFGDFDGDSVFLSDPVSHYQVGVDQPLVILGAPPIHFDLIGAVEIDPFDCFPSLNCPFEARYTQSSAEAKTLTHTYNSDWYVSNTTSGCAGTACTSGLGGKVEVSLTMSYGENFESTGSITSAVAEVSQRSTFGGVDELLVQRNSYDIWEYQILCVDCDLDDTVAVVVPSAGDRVFASWPRPDVDIGTYVMSHEAGNLLSYKSRTGMDEFLAGTDAIYANETAFQISMNSETEKKVTISETLLKKDTKGSIFAIDGSVSTSGSIGIVDAETSFSGGYSNTRFVSKEAIMKDEGSLELKLGRLDDNTDSYTITPFVYLRDGAFVLDYAIDGPSICHDLIPGCVKTNLPDSFFLHYVDDPDPAFRLPQLRDVEKGLGDNAQDRTRRTTEILIRPVDADGKQEPGDPAAAIKPGATVELRTRVHNYSLVDLNVSTTVTFYDGDPDLGGTRIGSSSIERIPARGTVEIPLPVKWTIPQMSQAAFDARRVFAELDIGPDQREIHTDNNIAWRPLGRAYIPEPDPQLLTLAAMLTLATLRRMRLRLAAA